MTDGIDYLAALALELVAYHCADHDPGDEDRRRGSVVSEPCIDKRRRAEDRAAASDVDVALLEHDDWQPNDGADEVPHMERL